MPEELKASEPKAHLLFTSHPAFQLSSLLVGMLGVVLAVFFYFRGQRQREPLYVVQPTRNIIVNRALAVGQRLTVLYDGRALDVQNVTTMQCTFWNAGSEPIKNSDILIPIKLALPAGAEILDISVIRQSRPSVINFAAIADKGANGARTNSATLNFSILEKGDGATLQLVYVGTPDATVEIEGTMVGAQVTRVGRPLDFERPSTNDDARSQARESKLLKISLLTYSLIPFIFTLPTAGLFRNIIGGEVDEATQRIKKSLRFLTLPKFWFVQGIWLLLVLTAYYYLFYRYPEVPSSLVSTFLV